MQLGWIDFSKEDRQKAFDVINLLSEQGAVDELGIGVIRDAFANYFFPGTSTIQTRAKYFLIVPYMLREAVDGRYGKDANRVLRAIDSAEKDCGIRLLEADPKAEGVIGSRVLPKGWVARKPSDIYWNGIRTFGIFCDYGLSIPEYVSLAVKLKEQKSVSRLGNRNDDAEENDKDDSDAGDIGNIRFWNLPIYHDDWRDNLTIELTQEEAFYLDKQIQKSTKGSLLEYVLKNHIDLNEYDDFASLTAELSEKVSEKLAYMMKLACDFNNLVYMARVRYNVMLGKLVHQIKNQDKKNTGYFAEGSRRYPVARLRFNVSNGEVRGMSLFALLYPSKTLSDMYLPIESLNNHESLEVIEKSVRLKLKEKLAIIEEKYGDSGNNKEDARWYYLAPMLMDGVIYAKHWIEDIVWEMNTDEEDTTSEVRSSSKDKRNKGFIAHIDKLRSYLDAPEEIHLGRKPEDLLETLVNMVLGSPAICIYRSNGRSTARATSLAKVFVNNFNLPESTAIIDLAYGRCRDDNSHWQNVLKYCKDGCFQAMIDEYIHMLKETAGFQSDGNQYQIVHDMMMDSLKIHTATYIADTYPDFKKRINGADRKSDGCRIRSSYAVGFTKDAGDNSKVVMRKENIRNAFNSPMRPFVLATTSIGQEGLDFHNYCRVIMHWNLPSNPIDVGRILRTFKIKKNVEVTDNGKIII